ncbi:MAG: hypothetical protein GF411_02365 [Candidatus Lokiarchaeota archaeon]|nr:hypothetical protein [Candidatus Lokiarchaeota archaeon]
MSQIQQITQFQCAVCNEPIKFDPENPTTFESKTTHEKFFGMQLTTYRVAHEIGNERHVNTVVVDHKHLFRGHKDAFVEQIDKLEEEKRLWLVSQKPDALHTHPYLENVFIMDRIDSWVMEGLGSEKVRLLELARLLDKKVEEAERVYETLPEEMSFTIADQDLRIWINNSRVACVTAKGAAAITSIKILLKELTKNTHRDAIPDKRLLILGLHVISEYPKINPEILIRLASDDRLYSKIEFGFIPRIPSIVERVERKYPFAKEILMPLLSGTASVINLLEQGQIGKISQIFDMLDYVDRRGLLR